MTQTPQDPNQPQYQPQPQGYHPGYAPPPPPKKKHTGRNILIGVVAFFVLVGACSAIVGTSDSSSDTSGDSSSANNTDSQSGDGGSGTAAKKPDNSSNGKGAITWGNWQVVGRIQTSKDFDDTYKTRMRVKNTGDSPDDGVFTLTYLKGNKILGSTDCTTSTINGGQVGAARCFSTDPYIPGWTEIQVEDTF